MKVKTKTLIRYQSSSSMVKRLKQSTLNMLSYAWNGFKSGREQIIHRFKRS